MKTAIICSIVLFTACTPDFRFRDKVAYTDSFYGDCCGVTIDHKGDLYTIEGRCSTAPEYVITQMLMPTRLRQVKDCPK